MTSLVLSLLLPILALGSPFVTTWNATQFGGSPSYQVVLSRISARTNVTIDWGDGSPLTTIAAGTNLTTPSHNYSTPGLVNVSVDGKFLWQNDPSQYNSQKAYKPYLMDIVSWGDGFLVDKDSTYLFEDCINLRVSADPNTHPVFLAGATLFGMFRNTSFDSPVNWDLGNVTTLFLMFGDTPLNKPITFTNTQGVTDLFSLFSGATKFNQPFSFDCTSVWSLGGVFARASAFNSPVNFTNTQKVTQFDGMFSGASSFNQPVILDTRSATSMGGMFGGAVNFNQPVNFNTSQVIYLNDMFANASKFNQPLSMDMSNALSLTRMFLGAVSFVGPVNFTTPFKAMVMDNMFGNTTSFTQDLSGWNVTNVTHQCAPFCPYCVLPFFPSCPNPCYPANKSTNSLNQSVCFTTPSAPSSSMAPSMAMGPSPSLSAASAGAAAPLLLLGLLFSVFLF